MIKTPLEKRIAHLKSVTMPEGVRTRIREELTSYADMHAYAGVAAVTEPSQYFSYFSVGFFRISVALVVLISMLGGTAYAASDARPGQALYPVKINFTEEVQAALIPSTEGKAAWHAILAERRLEEATDLAVKGGLDSALQETITDNFTKHVQDSSDAAAELQQSGNMDAALAVRSDLEARITAHESILEQVVSHLAKDGAADSSSELATKDLLTVVHERQTAVQGERLALEGSLDGQPATAASSSPVVAVHVDSETPDVPRVPGNPAWHALRAGATPRTSEDARATEIEAIMVKNSALLKFLGTAASTTASTTDTVATSTDEAPDFATSTVQLPLKVWPMRAQSEYEINLKKSDVIQ